MRKIIFSLLTLVLGYSIYLGVVKGALSAGDLFAARKLTK